MQNTYGWSQTRQRLHRYAFNSNEEAKKAVCFCASPTLSPSRPPPCFLPLKALPAHSAGHILQDGRAGTTQMVCILLRCMTIQLQPNHIMPRCVLEFVCCACCLRLSFISSIESPFAEWSPSADAASLADLRCYSLPCCTIPCGIVLRFVVLRCILCCALSSLAHLCPQLSLST